MRHYRGRANERPPEFVHIFKSFVLFVWVTPTSCRPAEVIGLPLLEPKQRFAVYSIIGCK